MQRLDLTPDDILESFANAASTIVEFNPDTTRHYATVVIDENVPYKEQKLELLHAMSNALGCITLTQWEGVDTQRARSLVMGNPADTRRVCEAFPIAAEAMDRYVASHGEVSYGEKLADTGVFVTSFSSALQEAKAASRNRGKKRRLCDLLRRAGRI